MTLLKVKQGHLETAILIFHNLRLLLRLKVFWSKTLKYLQDSNAEYSDAAVDGSIFQCGRCFQTFDLIRLSRTVQRTYTKRQVKVFFFLLYVYPRTFTFCFFLSSVLPIPPPPPSRKKNCNTYTVVLRSPLTLIKEISCYQRTCLCNMTFCLVRKLPASIVRAQVRVNRWRLWRWKDEKSLCTSDLPSQCGQISFALKKYQPHLKKSKIAQNSDSDQSPLTHAGQALNFWYTRFSNSRGIAQLAFV